jgi:glycosyltransferase involved in cell wall biosynthesis
MSTPLVSVVIPTFNRPQFLPRVIDSALRAAPDGDVEVIVVPNGPDTSWKAVAERYAKEARVLWQPIDIGNANAARNHGKRHACGEYLRFLDDDDVLSANASSVQIEALASENAEICSGTIDMVGEDGRFLRHMPHADNVDLFSAMARPGRICLPTAHLFLRRSIAEYFWDDSVPVEQDTEWMLRVSSQRDWRWVSINSTVGQWTWHGYQRASRAITGSKRSLLTIEFLMRSMEVLQKRDALTERRKDAIAEGLWEAAHRSFHFHPLRASRTIALAHRLSPGCRPPDAFFSNSAMRRINPLLIEWAGVPKRWINHFAWILAGRRHDP